MNSKDIIITIEQLTKSIITTLSTTHSFPKFQIQKISSQRTPQILPTTKRYFQILVLLGTIHKLLIINEFVTIREIYYEHKTIFQSQRQTESIIKDIKLLFGVSDSLELHVLSTPRGLLQGDVQIVTPISQMDFTLSMQLPIISSEYSIITQKQRQYLLIVEKEAFYNRLIQSNIPKQLNCIILCGRGYPDNATLNIASQIVYSNRNIVPCCLVDGDVFGIEIYLCYRFGSVKKNFSSLQVTNQMNQFNQMNEIKQNQPSCLSGRMKGIPNVKWCLLRPSYKLGTMKMTEKEIRRAKSLLSIPWLKHEKDVIREIELMIKTERKMELDELVNENGMFFESEIISQCISHSLK